LDTFSGMDCGSCLRSSDFPKIRIWPSLVISVLLHVFFFGLLTVALPLRRPGADRCLNVMLVTLGAEGFPGDKREEGGAGPGAASPDRERCGTGEPGDRRPAKDAVPPIQNPEPSKSVRKEEKPGNATPVTQKKAEKVSAGTLQKVKSGKAEASRSSTESICPKPEIPVADSGGSGTTESEPGQGNSQWKVVGSGESTGGGNAFAVGPGGSGGGNSSGVGAVDAKLGTANGPAFVRKVLPKYPPMARKLGKEGTVVLQVTIDIHGLPAHIQVVKSVGYGLDDEAVRALQNSTFAPAKVEGRPVVCKVLVPVRFQLKEPDDE
jgi:periplasmic protein TonB